MTTDTDASGQTAARPFIRITDDAAKWVGIFMTEQKLNPAEYVFRVGVKAGGCSGYEYVMRMDKPKETDNFFEHNGARIVIDEKSLRLLNGSTLHFIMKYQGAGFTIMSPRVAAACGCGSSVAFKKEDGASMGASAPGAGQTASPTPLSSPTPPPPAA